MNLSVQPFWNLPGTLAVFCLPLWVGFSMRTERLVSRSIVNSPHGSWDRVGAQWRFVGWIKPCVDASIYLSVPGTAKGTRPISRPFNQPIHRPSLNYHGSGQGLGRKKAGFGVRRFGSGFWLCHEPTGWPQAAWPQPLWICLVVCNVSMLEHSSPQSLLF